MASANAGRSKVHRLAGRAFAVVLGACLCAPALTAGAGHAAARALAGPIGVSLTGRARAVTPALLGLNGVNTTGPAWDDPAFDAVLQRFAPGVIRYPGGTAANYWSWAAGWFQPGSWPGEPSRPVDDAIPVYNAAVRAAGAVPLFDLNTVTYNGAIGSAAENTAMLDGQLQFLQDASGQGLPVRMVELGNELYLNGYTNSPPNPHQNDYAERFPTAADYATQMNAWISAIHQAFPEAQVAAVGADANDVRGGLTQRRATWNADVLPLLAGEDAVTLHENLRVFDATATPDTVLAEPYLHFLKLEQHELALFGSHRLPVWVTEFNMADMTPGHVFQGTWLHGLFVAEEALLFLGDPEITYVGLNATIGGAQSAPIFTNSHGFGSSGPATVPLSLTAAGNTLAMIQAAFHRAATAQPLAFSPSPALGTTGAPALLGEALTTPSGTELVIVNLSSSPLSIDLSGFFPGGYTAAQLTAPSVTTQVTGPASVSTNSATGSGTLTVEPYALADVA
jgi:hypothetical protein